MRHSQFEKFVHLLKRYGIHLILGVTLSLLVYEARRVGLSTDEPSHFAAGYSYWRGQDILQPADTPPLTRVVSGWIPGVLNMATPEQTEGWADRDAYTIGIKLLNPARGRAALIATRLPFLLFPLAMVYLVWRWARQIYSDGTALILAAICGLEPTILGHGALIKSDVPAACMALWFGYRAWKFLLCPTRANVALLALAVGLGVLTKYTLIVLLPISMILALTQGHRIFNLLAVTVIPYIGILVTGAAVPKRLPDALIDHVLRAQLPAGMHGIAELLIQLPWPPGYINGLLYLLGCMRADVFTGYLNGHKITGWVPEYFPIAFLLKESIPLLLLMLLGGGLILRRMIRREANSGEVVAICLGAVFLLTGVFSNFHIGVRHILPAIPFLIVVSGASIERAKTTRWGRVAVVILVGWLGSETALVYPNSLSYCNEIAGGSTGCWRYLADSNLDWGQNYPELGKAMRRTGGVRMKGFLWSFDSLWHYAPEGTFEQLRVPSAEDPVTKFSPGPGYYAVSVNFLTGLALPKGQEDYLEVFRRLPVHSRAGYSILIYKID